MPIATGENEYTRYGFRDLIEQGGRAILNADAQFLGGVTEFMKVAALAQAHDLAIAPHGSQDIHVHLVDGDPERADPGVQPAGQRSAAGAVPERPAAARGRQRAAAGAPGLRPRAGRGAPGAVSRALTESDSELQHALPGTAALEEREGLGRLLQRKAMRHEIRERHLPLGQERHALAQAGGRERPRRRGRSAPCR